MTKSAKTKKTEPIDIELKMMGDRILVIPSDEDGERATRGGLLIPATANNDRRLKWGQVISVGPNARHITEDDRVLYAPDAGYEVEVSGYSYLILRERDIHATSKSDSKDSTGMYL
ncbi:MAG: co-chaperone GroES [Acidimicrobiia bacterium]